MAFSKRQQGELGKASEDDIIKVLKTWDSRQSVAWHRIPDARAGSNQAALADFFILWEGRAVLVEVKEVDHEFRLPHKNFTVDQVARMRRFMLARGCGLVLVHFTKTDNWRAANPEWFIKRDGGSWDMSELPAQSLQSFLQPYSKSTVAIFSDPALKAMTCR